jgi:hypothetical protein
MPVDAPRKPSSSRTRIDRDRRQRDIDTLRERIAACAAACGSGIA